MHTEKTSPAKSFEMMQIYGFDPVTNCHYYDNGAERYFMGPECGHNVKIDKDESGDFVAVLVE